MLTDDEDNGLLQFLDRSDKIASVVSGLAGVAALVLAVTQMRRSRAAPDRHTATVARVRHVAGFFVNRRSESRRIRRALTDRRTRVILVHGPAGVGKTELVRHVLEKERIVHGWHSTTPAFSPTVDTILRELYAIRDRSRESVPHLDDSPIGHLETILRDRGTKRHVIVFDSAERLLNDDRQLTDLALDEALDLLATGPRHGVKIVLVTDTEPVAAAGGEWADKAHGIAVDGLPLEHFRTFAARGVAERTDLLASLDDRTLTEVHRDLGGRPRLAKLFDAIIECENGSTALSLAADLHDWAGRAGSVDRIGDRLRHRMTEAFRSDRRRVYRAVAAFATPVDAATVAAVVDEGRERDDQLGTEAVRRELIELSRHAIFTDLDRRVFFLPPAEARRVLEWQTEDDPGKIRANRQLLASAAEALRQRRKADLHGDWADPQASLAEVDAWLRADLPDAAFRSIEEMDTNAGTGSPAMLFRVPRERVAPHILSTEQPANYSVLGYLYHASGDYTRATDAYRSALGGIPDDRPTWKAKVYVNLAGLEWAQGFVESAFVDFEHAHRLAPQDPAVIAGALTGMARCRRRDGQFTAASAYLNDALHAAGTQPGRMVPTAVRLVRLYVEGDQLREAEYLIERIRESAEQAGDKSLHAAYRDAQADLRLAQGRWDEAMRAAREALRLALSVHDPVTALQARSTICVVRMHRGEFQHAAREATLARRYGGTDSLIVIALQGISCRRVKHPIDSQRAFGDLLKQAGNRTDWYQRDFAAWTLQGVALCARALDTGTAMDPAIAAFQRARHRHVEPAPTLTRLMLFLLESLATDDVERRRLQPALDELGRALAQKSTSNMKKTDDR
jgi:tetratricopeptide (TPR) repeat protein